MGFKYFMFGGSSGNTRENPATNGCVFATAEEAERAHAELFYRWWGTPPEHFVGEVPEEANYEFPADAARPRALPKEST